MQNTPRTRSTATCESRSAEVSSLITQVCDSPEEAIALVNHVSEGISVLMLAIRCNHPNVVQLLLQHGADPAYVGEVKIRQKSRKTGRRSLSLQRAFTSNDLTRKTEYETRTELASPLMSAHFLNAAARGCT